MSKPPIDKNKQKNKKILEKVNQWQNFKFVKPLICKNESCQEKVFPKESQGKIILICPKCNSKQSYVPKMVIETNLCISNKLIKNSQNRFNQ